MITRDNVVGMPMCGCVSPCQLADILNALDEYPDASSEEISGVLGYRPSLISAVRRHYRPEPTQMYADEDMFPPGA